MSSLESDRLSCSNLIGDFALVGLGVFFTAFEKITSGFGFSLRSFRSACNLGMRSFVWIWMISVSLSDIGQLFENALWSASQWQHLISVLVHLLVLCPWLWTSNMSLLFHGILSLCAHI